MSKEEFDIDEELDTRGLFCPEPLFQTLSTSETLESVQVLKVIADEPVAEKDLTRWAKKTGAKILSFNKDDDDLIFVFKIP